VAGGRWRSCSSGVDFEKPFRPKFTEET
jgi:hypothetical protein